MNKEYRTFEEYKKDVADKLDKIKLTEWCYDMSRQLNNIANFVKNLKTNKNEIYYDIVDSAKDELLEMLGENER